MSNRFEAASNFLMQSDFEDVLNNAVFIDEDLRLDYTGLSFTLQRSFGPDIVLGLACKLGKDKQYYCCWVGYEISNHIVHSGDHWMSPPLPKDWIFLGVLCVLDEDLQEVINDPCLLERHLIS